MALNFPWTYPVRAVQVIFAIIVLGLTAYLISELLGTSDTVNFLLFSAIWTAFVAVPYLAAGPAIIPNFPHRFVLPAVEGVTMVFWFAGFIALATALPPPKYCTFSACHAGQAAAAFGAFEWALFLATTIYAGIAAMRNRSNSPSTKFPAQTTAHAGV